MEAISAKKPLVDAHKELLGRWHIAKPRFMIYYSLRVMLSKTWLGRRRIMESSIVKRFVVVLVAVLPAGCAGAERFSGSFEIGGLLWEL